MGSSEAERGKNSDLGGAAAGVVDWALLQNEPD